MKKNSNFEKDQLNTVGSSFVEFLAITVKVICPGFNSFNPSSLLIRLQPGGNMLLTVTRLQISMPAFRKAASKELR